MNEQASELCRDITDAIVKKNTQAVRRFLENGASPNERIPCHNATVMPLALCMQHFDEDVARLLLESGLDVNALYSENENDTTSNNYMETAIRYQNIAMIKLLLEFGFDLTVEFNENYSYSYIYSLIHTLSFYDKYAEMIELLLLFIEKGAPIGVRELRQLPYCCQWSDMQLNRAVAELLVACCKDINEVDMQGCSTLHVFLREYTVNKDRSGKPVPKEESVRDVLLEILLADSKIDVTLRSYNDESPLYLACVFGPEWAVEKLLLMGADAHEVCTAKNISPIHAAAKEVEKLSALIEFGADINTPDEEGNNLLHLACGVKKEYIRNEMKPVQNLNVIPQSLVCFH